VVTIVINIPKTKTSTYKKSGIFVSIIFVSIIFIYQTNKIEKKPPGLHARILASFNIIYENIK